MSSRATLARLAGVGLVVLALDQVIKTVVVGNLEAGEVKTIIGPVDLTLAFNDGIAFGIASGAGPLVIGLALVALCALGFFVAGAPPGWPTALAGGLILGGAMGNLVDRVGRGEVIDFVSIPPWPAFNLADASITIGVVALAVIVIRSGGKGES